MSQTVQTDVSSKKQTAHRYAALMMEYAKDAAETDTPWERWEVLDDDDVWKDLDEHPRWYDSTKYRRKREPERKTVIINGHEVAAPMSKALAYRATYYTPSIRLEDWFERFEWRDDNDDKRALERGLCFETEADAVAYAKALVDWKDKEEQP